MNIVVPMAGASKNFENEGYNYSKSFIEIAHKPLFQYVCESLNDFQEANFIFVVNHHDAARYHIDKSLRLLVPGCKIVTLEGETAGAACSVLLGAGYIDNEDELIIYNGDQLSIVDLPAIIDEFRDRDLDGGVVTFHSVHPRWSYVRVDEQGKVIEAAEKRPISQHATTGCYYYRHGSDFVRSAKRMIRKDANVDGKYYVCPSYNEMILEQKNIGIHEIVSDDYFPLTNPKEVAEYEVYVRSRK